MDLLVALHNCAKALWVEWPNFLTCQKCIWPLEWRPEADNWPSLCPVNCADNNASQKFLALWLSYQTKTGSNRTREHSLRHSLPLLLSLCRVLALISCYKHTYPDSALYLLLVSPTLHFFLSHFLYCHQTQISDSDLEKSFIYSWGAISRKVQ